MWKSLRLAQKIWLSFSVLLIGYCVSILLGFRLGQQTETRLRHVSESLFTAATQSQIAFIAFNEQIDLYNNAVLLEDESLLDTAQQKAETVHHALSIISSLSGFRLQSPRGVRIVMEELREFTERAHKVYGAMSSMADEFDEEDEGDAFDEEEAFALAQQTLQLRETLETFTSRFSDELKNELSEISDTTRRRRYLELSSFLLVLTISLFLTAILIRRAIVLPLTQLTDIASKIAVGDLSGHLSLSGHDEFGQVASAFRKMMAYIREIAHTAQRLSSGEISVQVRPRSEHDVLNQAFANTIRYLWDTADVAEKIAKKDLQVEVSPRSEHDVLNLSFQRMIVNLREMMDEIQHSVDSIHEQNWHRKGQNDLNTRLRGEQAPEALAERIISYLADYLNAQVGGIFLADDSGECFCLAGRYAYEFSPNIKKKVMLGDGLVGQAALENRDILVEDVPEDYLCIRTGFLEVIPTCLLLMPFSYENRVTGIIELGASHTFSKGEIDLLRDMSESIGIAFHTAVSRVKMQELLEETQRQAEELQKQHRLLEDVNVDLRQAKEELHEAGRPFSGSQSAQQHVSGAYAP